MCKKSEGATVTTGPPFHVVANDGIGIYHITYLSYK